MTRIRLTAVVLGALVTAGAAFAEELSLADAIERALADSPQVAAAQAEVEFSEHGAEAAGSASWPTLGVSGSYGSFSGDVLYGRFIPGVPGNGSMSVGPYDRNTTAAIELKQVLYAGGGIDAAKRASGVESRMAAEGLRARRRELSYQVTRAYYEVLLAERRAEVATKSIERSRESLDMIKLRFAEQEALKVELLGAEGHLTADKLVLLEATNDLDLARRSLNRLLGRPQDGELSLSDSLEGRLQVPPEATGVEDAAAANPGVRMAGLGVEQADAALGSARSLSRPKLELSAVYTWIDNELFFEGQYAGAVVNLSIPFFQDVKAGSAAKRRARAQKTRADAMLADATSAVELQTIAAYRGLEERLAAVEAARKNLEYHAERYRVTQSGYREEMVTFSEVLDRHDDLRQAELGLSGALFQTRIQEAEIRRLAGGG
jgi:cobalt-zinc-cadmium efflux system outer membrane protein